MPTINDLGGIYSTGTINVVNGGLNVTGNGTFWRPIAEVGDWVYAQGQIGLVKTVSNVAEEEVLGLELGWTGSTANAIAYRLIKMSWLRYDPALTQAKTRKLLEYLAGIGFFHFVEGATPDVATGSNGDWALKVNTGNWTLWHKESNAWVLYGTPVGINFRVDVNNGNWSSGANYLVRDLVRYSGKLWYAKAISTNQTPGAGSAYWTEFYPFPVQAGICIVLDSFGSELAVGPAGDFMVPFACTLKRVQMRSDGVGSAVLDIWKRAFASGVPTVAHTITASAKPTLSGAQSYDDSVLTGWTTALDQGDALRFNIDSCSGITRLSITLHVERIFS